LKLPYIQHIFVLKYRQPSELYPFLAASKKPETLKRASPQATKMYTFCEKAIEVEGEFQKVPLDLRVTDKIVCIRTEVSKQEQAEILSFLDKNSDVFTWSTFNLVGVSRDVIEHRLRVSSNVRPKK
jgi:hypothetical protein